MMNFHPCHSPFRGISLAKAQLFSCPWPWLWLRKLIFLNAECHGASLLTNGMVASHLSAHHSNGTSANIHCFTKWQCHIFFLAIIQQEKWDSLSYGYVGCQSVPYKTTHLQILTLWGWKCWTAWRKLPETTSATMNRHSILEAATCPRLGHFVTSIHPNMRKKFREVDRPASTKEQTRYVGDGAAVLDDPYHMANHYKYGMDHRRKVNFQLREALHMQ